MASTTDNFKVFKRLSIYIEDILSQSISYLTTKFDQNRVVFTAASPFGQILLVTENLTQMVFYYIEDAITELNINEATRLTSVYSLATLAGHNPSRAVSAIGEISISTNADAIDAPYDVVIIPTLTRVRCLNNGLVYILDLPQEEIKFSLSGKDNGLKLPIRQGIVETQTVTAKGLPLDSFSIGSPQNFYVDNFFVNVYVNGEKWKKYDSILDMPRGENAFLIKTGITSGIDLFFGNGNYGKIPPFGSIINVEYLVTEGSNGNIRTNDPNKLQFEFVDTGFSLLGEEINLNDYFTIAVTHPPFFGSNPEDSNLTRLIAPRTSKSFALVNADHYEILLRKLKLFSIINVFLDPLDNRVLNLFLVPDIRKTFNTGQDYFSASIDRFIMSDYQKNELLKYIEKSGSKLISTDIKIIDPIPSRYVLNITVIVFDDVSTDLIKRDIYNNIGNYFVQNTRRGRIPKSDLIKIIEEVNGVDTVSVTVVSEKQELLQKNGNTALLASNALVQPALIKLQADPASSAATVDSPKKLSKRQTQPLSPSDLGTDEFNDIIINEKELPLVRGGFIDRYGNSYAEGISEESLGAINIQIKEITPRPKIR